MIAPIPIATAARPAKSIRRGTVSSRDSRIPRSATAIAASAERDVDEEHPPPADDSVKKPPKKGPTATATAASP